MRDADASPMPHRSALRLRSASAAALSWPLEIRAVAAITLLCLCMIGSAVAGLLWLGPAEGPAALHRHLMSIMLPGLTVGALATAMSWIVFRRFARQVRQMTRVTQAIGRDPMATAMPWLQGGREFMDLSAALRSLLRRVGFAEWQLLDARESETAEETSVVARRMRPSAHQDRLTGLLDREAFLIFAEDAIPYFQRYRRGIAVLIVDIDHFKAVTARHGDAAGDDVLRHVADVLDLSLRKTDKVSRFGGDQFVVLLREISEADTIALANRMRVSVESLAVRYGDTLVPVTVSIGAALVADHDRDIQCLIERADRALYAAKRSGRNCVRFRTASVPPASQTRNAA